jgi:hypothetical protein
MSAVAPEPIDTSTSTSPVRHSSRGSAQAAWKQIAQRAPRMAATIAAYLDQLAVSSRPATVSAASLVLRQFADHVTSTDPACTAVAGVERRHIEAYKIALAARPGRDGGTVTTETIRNNLGMLRTFFERADRLGRPRRTTTGPGAHR